MTSTPSERLSFLLSYLPSVRTTLIIDANLNALGTIPFVFFPHRSLAFIAPGSAINPLSLTLIRWFGVGAAALSVPMFIAAGDKRNTRERRLAIWTVASVEAGMLMMLGWQWGTGGTGLKEGTEGGFMACLVPFFLWRVWVLGSSRVKEGRED
ncbi:hypothetical protein MMC21_007840 [Puttea exsequens]|nr:hypothetical protein [Puttea exsequens]